MSDKPAIAELDLSNFLRTSGNQLSFKDLLANKNINIKNTENGLVKITIDGYTTKIFIKPIELLMYHYKKCRMCVHLYWFYATSQKLFLHIPCLASNLPLRA